ncbi:MAG TPA: phenylacetate--CoA ligase family protein [Actinokineospora sp.]|jgi:phenylacetate-CoA ligase|nr:phenylacetate--CoA ligase family protein [Actinokineospora sp.]
MIWHHEDRAAILRAAREEIGNHSGTTPDPGFYHRKLAEVWARAARTTAYAGLGEYSPAAFDAQPVTPREALKADPLDFATVGPGGGLRYYETTGSTGVPTPTPRLAEDIIWNTVSVAHAWESVIGRGDRVISLLPSDVVPVGDLVSQVCDYLGIAHVRAYPFATGICDWDRLIQLWRAFRPTAVFLAPGVALQWTRLVKQRGILAELSTDVRAMMLLGEVNTAPFRGRLGRWWGASAFDASYGSTETGTLASTCAAGGQHLLPAATYFELATPTGLVPIDQATEGQLVVTPLNAYARPLLRLNTGDTVSIGADCPCGRATPLVTVHGRVSDGLSVRGVPLAPRGVEEVVYGSTDATGYLIEIDAAGGFARLLLERDVDAARAAEPAQAEALQQASVDQLDVRWDQVAFVNTLPGNTKSGASQKSWKRSNIRILENA